MEGRLEGLARAESNEGIQSEGALDLRLQVRRPADRRLWGNEGRLLRVVQEHRWTAGGYGHHALTVSREVGQPSGERPRHLGSDLQVPEPLPSPGSLNHTTSTMAITLSSDYSGRHSGRRNMSGYRIHRQVTEFGEHVRGWRMVLGLTAQQVSERAGITRDTLRKIESGNPNVSFNSVTQVLRALGILDQLVDAADPLASDIGRLRAGRLTRKRAR